MSTYNRLDLQTLGPEPVSYAQKSLRSLVCTRAPSSTMDEYFFTCSYDWGEPAISYRRTG